MLNQFEEGEPLAAQMTALASGGPFSHVVTIPRDPRVAALESDGRIAANLESLPIPPWLRLAHGRSGR